MIKSIQARTDGVAFRRPTFDLGRVLSRAFQALSWRLELLGRAKAASELYRMGYTDQARELMLGMVNKERA